MPEFFDFVLKGGAVVNHDGIIERDIAVKGGRIAGLGSFARERAETTFDAGGLHVLPGVIDTQVHFREPGLEHKEDLETGSRAAVLGGVTGVFEMPNTEPTTTDGGRARRQARARARAACTATTPSTSAAPHENAAILPRARAAARLLPASRCSWAPRPARCWSPTTRRLARVLRAGQPPRRLPRRGRERLTRAPRASARHGDWRSHPDVARRRGRRDPVHRTAGCAWHGATASASTCCT